MHRGALPSDQFAGPLCCLAAQHDGLNHFDAQPQSEILSENARYLVSRITVCRLLRIVSNLSLFGVST